MYVLIIALLSNELTILPYQSLENCTKAMETMKLEIPAKELDYMECQKAEITPR